MVSNVETRTEYAIEVPGRGYIGQLGILRENADTVNTLPDAFALLRDSIRKYFDMGCPEIAKTLRIIKRTATLTRGDWEAIDAEYEMRPEGVR